MVSSFVSSRHSRHVPSDTPLTVTGSVPTSREPDRGVGVVRELKLEEVDASHILAGESKYFTSYLLHNLRTCLDSQPG
jgi:hypothetical protein